MSKLQPFVQVENLSKSFGDLVLFHKISFGIAQQQRVALIAQNGKGKSTLLDILAGNKDYEEGSVVFRRGLKIAYLKQTPEFPVGLTVFQACFQAANEVTETIARYELKMQEIAGKSMDAEAEELLHLMDHYKAWDYEVRIKQILSKLKIPNFTQKVGQLSGGELKRLALANVLITEPDLLILDEPTNHLDLDMIEWLENYLTKSGITLLMVTHDRYFLDRVCDTILELEDKQLYCYNGNYAYYLEKRRERLEISNTEWERAQNLYRKELEWMRRMPQARGTKAKARSDAFYELEGQVSQRRKTEQLRLGVKASYLGSKVLEAKYISKSYGELKLLEDFYYQFAPFEKVGIVGANGSGKTTFLRLLMGEEPCDRGSIDIGSTVRFGYFSQEGLSFDENKKVIDVVRDIAEEISLGNGKKLSASQFLTHFLFSPEVQHNYASKLSGGEKRRLYLCTVLMTNPNFLVLDEPTNDLDILSLNILEEYLVSFKGCVLVVSHDRFFMDKIVDHLLVFEGDAIVRDFPGNYTQYREWKEQQDALLRKEKESERKSKTNLPDIEPKKEESSANRKRTYREEQEFIALEKEIVQIEENIALIENDLASGQLEGSAIEQKCIELSRLNQELDKKAQRWMELGELEKK